MKCVCVYGCVRMCVSVSGGLGHGCASELVVKMGEQCGRQFAVVSPDTVTSEKLKSVT